MTATALRALNEELLGSDLLTYEDYAAIPPDGRRHEIINGKHVVSPAPRTRHQRLVGELFFALRHYLREHGGGEVFIAPFDVLLDPHTVVQPDVCFVSEGRLQIVDEANCKGAPDLVIEVLSDGTRRQDLRDKRALYAASGVREYWVVDGARDGIWVLRLDGSAYRQAADLTVDAKETLETPLLPGFSLPLASLFG